MLWDFIVDYRHPHTIDREELINKMEEKCSWNLAESTNSSEKHFME